MFRRLTGVDLRRLWHGRGEGEEAERLGEVWRSPSACSQTTMTSGGTRVSSPAARACGRRWTGCSWPPLTPASTASSPRCSGELLGGGNRPGGGWGVRIELGSVRLRCLRFQRCAAPSDWRLWQRVLGGVGEVVRRWSGAGVAVILRFHTASGVMAR